MFHHSKSWSYIEKEIAEDQVWSTTHLRLFRILFGQTKLTFRRDKRKTGDGARIRFVLLLHHLVKAVIVGTVADLSVECCLSSLDRRRHPESDVIRMCPWFKFLRNILFHETTSTTKRNIFHFKSAEKTVKPADKLMEENCINFSSKKILAVNFYPLLQIDDADTFQ